MTFFAGGVVPNPLDIRFKKVSGLSAEVTTETVGDGGQNLYTQKLPTGVSYGNLVLERMVIGSPLKIDLQLAISGFKFAPCTVLVALSAQTGCPCQHGCFLLRIRSNGRFLIWMQKPGVDDRNNGISLH